MERIVEFSPAFDKRNTDPKKNYGIHGVELRFILKGKEGAVQFLVFTNWMLPHVQEEMNRKATDADLVKVLINPMPADIGYHSPKPMYEEQTTITDKCPYLDNKPCYYDGSGLAADKVYNIQYSFN